MTLCFRILDSLHRQVQTSSDLINSVCLGEQSPKFALLLTQLLHDHRSSQCRRDACPDVLAECTQHLRSATQLRRYPLPGSWPSSRARLLPVQFSWPQSKARFVPGGDATADVRRATEFRHTSYPTFRNVKM